MPRIRTIKPEFCTSEQVAECSTNARLLFVLMWCFCDDAGRHPANSKRLKMEVFPGDAFTDAQIKAMVQELIDARLLVEYTYENTAYWQVTGWKHQRIEKPNYKYPPSDKDGKPLPVDDQSTTTRRPVDDGSLPEGNGRERNGEEGNGVEEDGAIVEVSTTTSTVAGESLTEFEFPVVGGGGPFWCLTQAKFDEYAQTYPGLDIAAEMRAARQFCRDNVAKRKTARGMLKFLNGWLARSQNSPRFRAGGGKASSMEIAM